MIKITIIKSNQNIMTIEATGHSGYAEEGSDIVCSAVSTLTESLINGLEEVVGIHTKYVIDEEIPHLSVSLPKDISPRQMEDAQVLMRSTYLGLKNIADSYSQYINIKEKQND